MIKNAIKIINYKYAKGANSTDSGSFLSLTIVTPIPDNDAKFDPLSHTRKNRANKTVVLGSDTRVILQGLLNDLTNSLKQWEFSVSIKNAIKIIDYE